MTESCLATCVECGRPIPCGLCGNPVETVPTLDNKVYKVDGVPICLTCAAELNRQNNQPHPLTTKDGGRILQSVLQEILNS